MTTSDQGVSESRRLELSAVLVSHTHWDREWYRTFQAFRARLVDTVDRVLDLLAADSGWKFLLDGQSIVIEDYLAIRPERREELAAVCRSGRLAVGPWYVQPDSLLPAGETHVRNLLEGRRVAVQLGAVSTVAYTPDSFGHPAQFPQLFAGFGLGPFVYWRGNGAELDDLPSVYAWIGPDGSTVVAYLLAEGYFAAAGLPEDAAEAAGRLEKLATKLADRLPTGLPGEHPVLLMNGVDHALPHARTAAVADALEASTGWKVRRGLLEDAVGGWSAAELKGAGAAFCGELVGGRVANLLSGVWSARLYLKLRNRAAEAALIAWAEPWAAWGRALGLPDERPALRVAWRALLENQAHDSICGCSADAVHNQMLARYDAAEELATQTTTRLLSRLAGLGEERRVPWQREVDCAVFNPSALPRTEVVSFPLEGYPVFDVAGDHQDIHPLTLASLLGGGFTVDGRPARVVEADDPGRFRILPEQEAWDVQWVAEDIPAFGWRRFHLAPSAEAAPDEVDTGRVISAGRNSVVAEADGGLTVSFGDRTFTHLGGLEDVGDRGDTYDHDPVSAGGQMELESVEVQRRRHPGGIQELSVTRHLSLPAQLTEDRKARSHERAPVRVTMRARVGPGIERVDMILVIDNGAKDHRLRLLFPTPTPAQPAEAATTFDVVPRPPFSRLARGGTDWMQPPAPTFPHQGWVAAGGLAVAAPGLPEAEVGDDGTIAITVLRAVGWLARLDLHTRPIPAGPALVTPGAQCLGRLTAKLSLFEQGATRGDTFRTAAAAEHGLRSVPAGPPGSQPGCLLEPDRSLLRLAGGHDIVLSALKPAEDGDGMVVRLLNVGDAAATAELHLGLPLRRASGVRLDEGQPDEPDDSTTTGDVVEIKVPAHGLRSVLVELEPSGERAVGPASPDSVSLPAPQRQRRSATSSTRP